MNTRIIKNGIYKDFLAEDLVTAQVNRFKNWHCSAGVEGIFIDWYGDIWPATCINNPKYKLGSIYGTDEIQLQQDYLICSRDTCPCLVEVYLPKYKNNSDDLIVSTSGNVNLLDFDAITRAHECDIGKKYIMWAFGRKCNFDCSYCDDVSHSRDDDNITQQVIQKVLDYSNKFRDSSSLIWSFTGGEPTLNPSFLSLVKELSGKGDSVTVSSNASKDGEYYIELAKYAWVNLSIHFEFLKLNKFEKVLKSILDDDYTCQHVGINFMIMPSTIDKCSQYIDSIKDHKNFPAIKSNLKFNILRLKNSSDYYQYSEEDLNRIKNLQEYCS